ncbi:hypothetical protein NDU88_005999 [Pleurodeles waltl]|uniref:Uncharacterized protein n=1 Tax=Pleurodeles waltl TaxID=8319 RepID=A0AAV7VLJ5_PLEWA|nr:hypothetical protein NDU88_005999 [Pleurodeles waltl]
MQGQTVNTKTLENKLHNVLAAIEQTKSSLERKIGTVALDIALLHADHRKLATRVTKVEQAQMMNIKLQNLADRPGPSKSALINISLVPLFFLHPDGNIEVGLLVSEAQLINLQPASSRPTRLFQLKTDATLDLLLNCCAPTQNIPDYLMLQIGLHCRVLSKCLEKAPACAPLGAKHVLADLFFVLLLWTYI